MKRCIIVGAGEFFETKIPTNVDDLIIAADGGLDYLKSINIIPNLVMGDMDSAKSFCNDDKTLLFPSKKDDTDTVLAIKEGFKRGYREFWLFGGTGGRIDHTLANIKALHFIVNNGGKGFLFSQKQVITAIKNDKIIFPKEFCGYFSIFALGGNAIGVNEKGSEYELLDYYLKPDSSLGTSNEFCKKETEISVKEGILAVVFERQGEFKLV